MEYGVWKTNRTLTISLIIPVFFEEKKGIMCYHLSSVRLSGGWAVRPSIRQQFTSISFYTIDARITKPICMIPLCLQMVATYLKFFSIFQFCNNSDFSDFTQKCNFSIFFTKLVKFCLMYWGKSYTTYIKQVLSCDFQIILENGNLDGGGGENVISHWQLWKKIVCYFSYPSTSLILLMLESRNMHAWFP